MSSGSATDTPIAGNALRDEMEWLEADGLGGFASGTATGVRTRRYHALLLTATTPPTGRMVLVNGVEAWVERGGRAEFLTRQRYGGEVMTGGADIESFTHKPWPTWVYRLGDGTRIEHQVFVPRGRTCVVASWRVLGGEDGVTLCVRPLLSGRDYHALHHENGAVAVGGEQDGCVVRWSLYPGVPYVACATTGHYTPSPDWYRGFSYSQERDRGFEHTEDLASPGVVHLDLSRGEGLVVFGSGADGAAMRSGIQEKGVSAVVAEWRAAELSRRTGSTLDVAADAYIVQRGSGTSIVAGYPWFTDWGRDAMISVRGLCTARGRLEEAAGILSAWGGVVSGGLLPNRFPDAPGDVVEYNSVDAPLWYCVAAYELLRAFRDRDGITPVGLRGKLTGVVHEIVTRYATGTAMGIGMDESDGLLWSGTPGTNLTWMDARVREQPVTARIGKPVEVQALWVHALCMAGKSDARFKDLSRVAQKSLTAKFWNERVGCLYDVIDLDHRRGTADASIRPNQVLAVGGLPKSLLSPDRAAAVVETIERELLTPVGLRSLSPRDGAYRGRYEGGPEQRDGVYHQGTAWAWLMGPFAEAWVRVRGGTNEAKREARAKFLEPLLAAGGLAGLGHVPEIADGDAPHAPRGCPFQAWSVAEALRLDRVVLAPAVKATTRSAVGIGRSAPAERAIDAAHAREGGAVWHGTGARR